LNPIEYLWNYLKRPLASHEPPSKNIDELWDLIDAELRQAPVEICVNLIESNLNGLNSFWSGEEDILLIENK
jgi:RNAse (barnase) inhibitor barstar